MVSNLIKSQYLIPEYAQNYDSDLPAVYSEDIGGGAHEVTDTVERDAIPIAKRNVGMLVTYQYLGVFYTKRFAGPDTTNIEWEDWSNWQNLGAGGGSSILISGTPSANELTYWTNSNTITGGGMEFNPVSESFIVGATHPTPGSGSASIGGLTNYVQGSNSGCLGGAGMLVSGNYSGSLGGVNGIATGNYTATIGGAELRAHDYGETAVGNYNIQSTGNSTSLVSTNNVFVVGNGTSSGSRSNALSITQRGDITIYDSIYFTGYAPSTRYSYMYLDSLHGNVMKIDSSIFPAKFGLNDKLPNIFKILKPGANDEIEWGFYDKGGNYHSRYYVHGNTPGQINGQFMLMHERELRYIRKLWFETKSQWLLLFLIIIFFTKFKK